MKNSLSCAHVLHKTLNVVISRCCFAEDGKEMYQNVKRTCRVIASLIKLIVLRCRRCALSSLSSLLKFPNDSPEPQMVTSSASFDNQSVIANFWQAGLEIINLLDNHHQVESNQVVLI